MVSALRVLAFLCVFPTVVQDRPAEPDAEAQREILKTVRDLFKEEYARKLPADQIALAKKLFDKGVETNDDLPTKWVLLKEARDVAATAGDVETAMKAASELARNFAVDGPAIKLSIVTKMSTTRDPEVSRNLARACILLVTESVRGDSYDTASAAVAKAEALARVSQDATLVTRVQELKRDVTSLKEEFGRVKPMLDKPGTGDQEAVGRYLCFVKGNWDAGLPHLVAGAKGALRSVVEKDALNPADPAKQVDVAEGWSDIAQKEKSSWRRSRIHTRVRHWLEKAQPGATGVVKLKIEKKLVELEDPEPGSVNLLKLIDPRVDGILGDWSMDGGILVSPSAEWARAQIPYTPPDEYELSIVAERKEGGDSVVIGLGQGKVAFAFMIDAHPDVGGRAGLDLLDGIGVKDNPASTKGQFLSNNKPGTIVIAVRRTGVTASVDGKVALNWQGSFNRLSPSATWKARDPKAPLFVGAYGSRVLFSKIMLTPISGQGKKIR